MADPQPKPFDWKKLVERILWVIAVAVASYFGFPVPMMMGCVRPGPVVVIPPDPPPGPVVLTLKKVLLVRESGTQNDAMNLLVTSLGGGKGAKWLEEKGIELVGVVDPGEVDSKGAASKLITQWKAEIESATLPAVFLLDKDDKLIAKPTIPDSVTLDNFVKLCTEHHGEQSFSDLPYVDCDWSDWQQFGKGDNADVDTFEVSESEAIAKGAEPAFGQAPRPPPGIIDEENPLAGEPTFEDSIPLIPREQWPTIIKAIDDNGGSLDLLVTRIYDQKSEGSCVSNATCQALEIAQAIRRGRKGVVHLSAISLYKRCGSSPGSGSMVSTNLKEILGVGVLPLDNAENKAKFLHTMPNTGFYGKYPEGWKETAVRFRGHEVFDVRSFDGFITALLRGYPVVYGRSGHSICAVRPVYRDGQLFVKYANSWSPEWGDHGYGYDSESKIRAGAGWAFALRTVVDPELSWAGEMPAEGLANRLLESGTTRHALHEGAQSHARLLGPLQQGHGFSVVGELGYLGGDGDRLLEGPTTLDTRVQGVVVNPLYSRPVFQN
jgi:hypothetical protein